VIRFRDASLFVNRALAAGFAAWVVGVAPSNGATQPDSAVTCTNLVSGASWQIRINYERSTVDSNPAQISTTKISWHDRTDGGNYALDRRSGELTVIFASSTGGYFLHEHCNLEK
jgi:hypothetical protein